MHKDKLDEIDIAILEQLQHHARTKRGVLADHVGLSIPTISERLQKLEERGVISGYYAKVNEHKVGLDLAAYIYIMSESSAHYGDLVERATDRKEVLECHAVTGPGSHLLKVRVENTRRLEELLVEIQSWPGVKNTRTDIVLSTAKETSRLSLAHIKGKGKSIG